jgi:hypothetical protein
MTPFCFWYISFTIGPGVLVVLAFHADTPLTELADIATTLGTQLHFTLEDMKR